MDIRGAPHYSGAAMFSLQNLLAADFGTIPELIRAHARHTPAHPALIMDEQQLDYAALDALMDRVAGGLARDGVAAGDTIAILAATSLAYAATFLGALRAGAAVAPLPLSSSSESVADMLADCAAKLVFVDAEATRLLERAPLPPAARRIAFDAADTAHGFERWLPAPGVKPAPIAARPEAPFNIIYSSGTTGTPKGIVHANAMRWAHVRRGDVFGYGASSVTLVSTPLYSNTSLVSFLPGIALGGSVVLMAKFDAAAFLSLSQRWRVTHAMLVPVQYARILALPDFDRFDLGSYVLKFCTSAPFSAALKADVLRRWPGGLIEYYGLTEGGGTCVLVAHEFPHKLHTVGTPFPEHDIRLIGEDGKEVAAGEVGEVVGHSPAAMMSGYHNLPEKSAEAFWVDPTGKRFIRTGDVGRFDADGFLILLDRKKDMIISGGFNVYPSDLEAVLRQRPEVADAAVVGVPSTQWGETPVGFVVRTEGASTDAEAIRSWANERLGKTQRLSALEFVDVLPRSAIGKVLKRELRERYLSTR
jgi:long-chain acyl-CoA synthetase